MQKGYKRKAKGLALLQCIIGLIILIIVVLLLYFAITMDYSDKLQEGTQLRAYVPSQATAAPTAVPVTQVPATDAPEQAELVESTVPAERTPEPESEAAVQPGLTDSPTDAAETAQNESAIVSLTPAPSEAPTDEPIEEPTTEPAAESTPVPTGAYAKIEPIKNRLPDPTSKNVKLGITASQRSAADEQSVLYLNGYAYIDRENVDAAATVYRLVIVSSNGEAVMAHVNRVPGISGLPHEGASCSNVSGADFEVYLNVNSFPDDVYYLGIVFNNKGSFVLSQFPGNPSFSVVNHRVLTEVPTVSED